MAEDSAIWAGLIDAFLHDPPDKALNIQYHEARAGEYKEAVFQGIKTGSRRPDWDSARVERLPLPKAGEEIYVSPEGGSLSICHPLSGAPLTLRVDDVNKDHLIQTINKIKDGEEDPQKVFFLIWRLLPGLLAANGRGYLLNIPADTRMPDHTIWHHCGTAAAFYPPLLDPKENGAALLSFHLGPVQEFIAAARTLRDLWTGSMMLSWLSFCAMLPIIKKYGPTAVIYPSLRGLPFLDIWMLDSQGLDLGKKKGLWGEIASNSPCLPNKFLAITPWGDGGADARAAGEECKAAVAEELAAMSCAVKDKVDSVIGTSFPGWAGQWDEQIKRFFDVKVSALPLKGLDTRTLPGFFGGKDINGLYENARAVNEMFSGAVGAQYNHTAGEWQATMELSARLMDAARSIRNIPADFDADQDGKSRPKCSMISGYEQMGPADLEQSGKFWAELQEKISVEGVRLRAGDRLSAVAMLKRFVEPAYLRDRLKNKVVFTDTATVAARSWLSHAGIDPEKQKPWSGQWLHWPKQDFDKDDKCPEDVWKLIEKARKEAATKPPSYYAVLMMDADHMGRWLRGEDGPSIRSVYHKRVTDYLKKTIESRKLESGMKARRPLGPAAHMAISEALTNYSVHVAPRIVKFHEGQLIYAGGDDVLALLPVEKAVQCASALYRAFRGEKGHNSEAFAEGFYRVENRDMLMMGPGATLSAGIAVAHYKDDMRAALDAARAAERLAKSSGRNRLAISVLRRSGEHATSVMSWDLSSEYNKWVKAFIDGASDRWVYHLRAELPTLEGTGLPEELVEAEIKRQLNRAERDTRAKFGENGGKSAGDMMRETFAVYCAKRAHPNRGKMLSDFITLLQSASFFARGRD